MNTAYDSVPTNEIIAQTKNALEQNGINVEIVENAARAINAVTKIIPLGAKVFTATSVTVDSIGLADKLNGPDYTSVRSKLMELRSQEGKETEQRQIGAVPDVVVGSVHALTQDGKIMVASATGSQLSSEVYGASKVIYVVGAQKIVLDLNDGLKRIEEYIVPLEDARAMKAYGGHTSFNKLLVINKERPGRINVVIIKDNIGF
jgi:hypothetical protein